VVLTVDNGRGTVAGGKTGSMQEGEVMEKEVREYTLIGSGRQGEGAATSN